MAEKRRDKAVKRRPLDRERVLRAAIEIADAGGIEALSMRRLGRRLGVEAMSLYNHVSNKDDVLGGMLDIIVGEIEIPQSSLSWKEAMRGRALSMRSVFNRHPWALGLLEARRSPGPALMRYMESVFGVLRQGGFSIPMARGAFFVLDSYAYGSSIQEKNLPSSSPTEASEATEHFLSRLPQSEYPYLAEAAGSILSSPLDFAEEFERGLDLLLEALEAWRSRE
ncbi:MAG TPA: TetR/AcrR family transcriptional regulator [Longimicrobiales bacterium]|nr:TetR/AcrR family transcriptional regulator [Longimicrobiales bacterium]